MGLTKINGLILRRMIISGANELNKNKQLVDSLNVFPVPDGDTGTNMSLTALSASKEMEKSSSLSVEEIARLAANGSLRGARGNSGVILSQLIRGFSKGLEEVSEAGTKELAKACRRGVETAYKAVMKPKEGTILTVARACADAAEKYAEETEDIEVFMTQVLKEGHETLLKTKDMLPILKQADVVDAGGRGLLFILEGAFSALDMEEDIEIDDVNQEAPESSYAALSSIDNNSITFGYCTEFFINVKNAPDSVLNELKTYLNSIGDSLIVVSDDEVIKIHVHTDHPGLALEKALSFGSLSGLKIDNMREQHTNKIDFSEPEQTVTAAAQTEPVKEKETGFVSISMGSGFTEIFKNIGVDEIIEGGQTMNPSTEEILSAIARIPAKNVIILPNNKNIILAAEQAAKITEGKKVLVLPSKTVPEGIAAMINYNSNEEIDQAFQIMKNSIAAVRTGMVTYAVRDTVIGQEEIKEGDILAMVDGDIVAVGQDMKKQTQDMVDKLVSSDCDMVSVYYGCDVTEDDAMEIADYIEQNFPDCEVEVQCGNQPIYYYVISAE